LKLNIGDELHLNSGHGTYTFRVTAVTNTLPICYKIDVYPIRLPLIQENLITTLKYRQDEIDRKLNTGELEIKKLQKPNWKTLLGGNQK